MNEMMNQYNPSTVATITTLDSKIQVQDLSNQVVNYNSDVTQNTPIASFNESSKLFQNTVISKSMKDKSRIKMELNQDLFRKSTDDIYQSYNVPNMSNVQQQDASNFKVPQPTTSQTQGYKFQPPTKPNIKFTSKVLFNDFYAG